MIPPRSELKTAAFAAVNGSFQPQGLQERSTSDLSAGKCSLQATLDLNLV
jgi:hypothetical protein